ncbi:MAG: PrgI family protein, partial [Candidatus Dormibacteria bacterium]
ILGGAAIVAWFLYDGARLLVALPLAVAVATPVVAVGLAIALGQRHGMSGDRFALAAIEQVRAPHRLVPMTDDDVPTSAMRSLDGHRLAPLELPVRAIGDEGVLELHPDGAAVLARVSLINFGLRTAGEQSALVAAFGRFLNSQHAPIQVVVRSERADLAALVQQLRDAATSLSHPSLEAAALAHASYLEGLSRDHDIVRREALVVMRSTAAVAAADLVRRAGEMPASLSEAGVVAEILDGREAATILQRTMVGSAAAATGVGAPTEVVHGTAIAPS